MPWAPRTPQEAGHREERRQLDRRGARAHPGSGSGGIRFDGSTEEDVVEIKAARKSFVMNGAYMDRLYTEAVRQGKDAVMVVVFGEAKLAVECRMRRDT